LIEIRADSLMVKQPTHNRLSLGSIPSQPTKPSFKLGFLFQKYLFELNSYFWYNINSETNFNRKYNNENLYWSN